MGEAEKTVARQGVPALLQTVLDARRPRELAEFYRKLLGLRYRAGDELPPAGQPDSRGEDWLVLCHQDGRRALAFQRVDRLTPPTWPDPRVPQQSHLDTTVDSVAELDAAHRRALALGARLLADRADDDAEPLRVYADPAGHPFCIFVTP